MRSTWCLSPGACGLIESPPECKRLIEFPQCTLPDSTVHIASQLINHPM